MIRVQLYPSPAFRTQQNPLDIEHDYSWTNINSYLDTSYNHGSILDKFTSRESPSPKNSIWTYSPIHMSSMNQLDNSLPSNIPYVHIRMNQPIPHLDYPLRVGFIDLGTKSARLDIYEFQSPLVYRRLKRIKMTVMLGHEVFITGHLNEESKQRTLSAFQTFTEAMKALQVSHCLPIATSAMRSAQDGEVFAQQIFDQTGIRLEMISGHLEGTLIAKGIINNARLPSSYFGLLDIGGGSAEITASHKKVPLSTISIPFGAIRVQELFLKSNPPLKESIEYLRETILETLSSSYNTTKPRPKIRHFIGSSGSIQTIARVFREETPGVLTFSRKRLSAFIKRISNMSAEEIGSIPGVDEKRSEILLAGAIFLEEVLKFFKAKTFAPTEYALRDGLLDYMVEQLIRRKLPQK